ncbi:MAG: conserved exported protein of unknown function [Nitrosopumilales archaeon]|nr:MAG: conserved exported protein of unknown function [Nitrosopumilales archaeon]
MNKSVNTIALVTAAVLIGSLMSSSTSFAAEQESQTEIISIDGTIGIEKTTLSLFAPSDNTLPWGFVEGKIPNHVSDYPVIIQIYDSEGDAVHFAQTNVEDDGSYEYRFRVLSINDNQVTKIFEGDYSVKIFKVIYLNPGLLNQA